jgi:hypothetical protein
MNAGLKIFAAKLKAFNDLERANLTSVENPLWFQCRSGFSSLPNANPDQGSKTNADPCGTGSGSWSDLEVFKIRIRILRMFLGQKKRKNLFFTIL